MGYQKILVAFDGSEGSLKALHHSINLAKSFGAKLTVATVVKRERETNPDLIAQPNTGVIPAGSEVFIQKGVVTPDQGRVVTDTTAMHDEKVQAKGDEVLREARKVLDQEKVRASTEVLEGSSADQIERFAIANEMDLIVIGSRGLSGLKKLVLGSVSTKVVQKANCPVLVVK